MQTTTEPAMRGRVMALYMAIFAGGTPLGAPLVGWMIRYQRLRVRIRPRTSPRTARVHVRHRGDGHPLTSAIRVVTDRAAAAARERDRETATREIAVTEATGPR